MENENLLDRLLVDHWEEIAKNKALMVLKPDRAAYQSMQDKGVLITLFAYKGEEIVGYSVNIITKHLHYSDVIMTMNDVLYLDKGERNGRLGLGLIRETERICKEHGSHIHMWHAKDNSPLARILAARRYKVQDIVFSKEL